MNITPDYSPKEYGLNPKDVDTSKSKMLDIVGESAYQYNISKLRDAINAAQPGDPWIMLRLQREPGNKHDANAIKVSAWGVTVGYIARAQAARMATNMDKLGGDYYATGKIVGGVRGKRSFGVVGWVEKGKP